MTANEKQTLVREFADFLNSREDDTISVCRPTWIDTEDFDIGDRLTFTLTTGEKVSAICISLEDDKALFVLEDCLQTEYPMNQENTNEGGYENSELRAVLNCNILRTFPDKILKCMKPFENGDRLRLLTCKEVFGTDASEENEFPKDQIPYFEDRHNRIAFKGRGSNELESWWLQDKIENTAALFALADDNGYAGYNTAGGSLGVRPAFQI